MTEKQVSFHDVLSRNVSSVTPCKCYCKSVVIFLPNLNLNCKESVPELIDVPPRPPSL